ncbi:FeoA family protein [Sulfurimonas sp. HSL-1656]|uniref:FeoA family protein n=1 Tax=Thiomicrolovo TaxID=3451667 RepID=UPI0031F801B5
MKLTECMKGCSATIVKLHAQGPLKQRLVSFGVMKGARVELMGFAPAKSTVEIKVGRMRLALRKEEAELIEVNADAQ